MKLGAGEDSKKTRKLKPSYLKKARGGVLEIPKPWLWAREKNYKLFSRSKKMESFLQRLGKG